MILNLTNTFKNFSLWNQRAARVVPLLLILLISMQLAKMTWLVIPQIVFEGFFSLSPAGGVNGYEICKVSFLK